MQSCRTAMTVSLTHPINSTELSTGAVWLNKASVGQAKAARGLLDVIYVQVPHRSPRGLEPANF